MPVTYVADPHMRAAEQSRMTRVQEANDAYNLVIIHAAQLRDKLIDIAWRDYELEIAAIEKQETPHE